MKSKLKLLSFLGSTLMCSFFIINSVSAQVLGPNQMFIQNKETGSSALIDLNSANNVVTTTTTSATGSAITVTCPALITTFQKYGDQGVEVAKLQNFLNQVNGAKLNGKGFYGPATQQEVRNLQYTYGVKVTGVQHEKTTALINSINCGNIAIKQRMVATQSVYGMVTPVSVTTTLTKGGNVMGNIYPNTPIATKPVVNVVKEYGNNNTRKEIVKANADINATVTSTTTNTFWNNLKADFAKIKENYKAYILVFVLVLALFWFLRKAATE